MKVTVLRCFRSPPVQRTHVVRVTIFALRFCFKLRVCESYCFVLLLFSIFALRFCFKLRVCESYNFALLLFSAACLRL